MIGLEEAVRATYDELDAAARAREGQGGMRFRYASIELEMTLVMSDSREQQGGLKIWVLDGFRKRLRGKSSTHTVRVTIQPVDEAGGELSYSVQP